MARIDTVSGRARLPVRREPYWHPLPDLEGAYVGYRAGPGTWLARLREDGKQQYHAFGKLADYQTAVRAVRGWVEQRRKGVLVHDASVGDACRAYLENLRLEKGEGPADEAAGRLYRRVLGRKFRTRVIEPDPLARIPLNRLRPDHVKKWRDAMVPAGVTRNESLRQKRASANRDFNSLIAALNYAYRMRMVSSDFAWKAVQKFSGVQASSEVYVPLPDRRKLLEHAHGSIRDLILGVMLTGARPVELARATVGDYARATDTLVLRSFKGRMAEAKTRPVRLADISPEAAALFRRLAKGKVGKAPLFARDDGKPWHRSVWSELFIAARDAAGLRGFTLYDLRHAWIADSLAAGVDPSTVAKVCGTSLLMISKTYSKYIPASSAAQFARVTLI